MTSREDNKQPKFKNRLSEYQIAEISRVTGLVGSNLEHFVTNIEYQLDDEGVLPTDDYGQIDFKLKDKSSNNYRECRDKIKDIRKDIEKLKTKIQRLNSISYRHLNVSSHKLGFKESNEPAHDGYFVYDDINAVDYLSELDADLEGMLEHYEPSVSATSGRVTESLHKSWCFGVIGGLPNKKDMAVKLSEGNAFLEVVAVVTSWNFETAKKNVSNATWYKNRKAAFEKGYLKTM
ncbi:hypothetical protein [Photobacterium sp. R1]